MRQLLYEKWFSVIYALGSIFLGYYLIGRELITYKTEWAVVSYVLSNNLFTNLFIIFGVAKLVGVAFHMRKTKNISLTVLNSGWALLAVAFFLQNGTNPNAGWIFAGIIFLFGLGIATRGGAHE